MQTMPLTPRHIPVQVAPREGGVQVQPLAPARHRFGLQVALGQLVPHEQGDPAAFVQPRSVARVEVDDDPIGTLQLAALGHRPLVDVQLEGGEVGQPGERREVVADREPDRPVALARP